MDEFSWRPRSARDRRVPPSSPSLIIASSGMSAGRSRSPWREPSVSGLIHVNLPVLLDFCGLPSMVDPPLDPAG